MKKLVIRLLIAVVVLVIVGALAVRFFLDGAIKRGVETIGPMLTKTEMKLNSVSLSLLSGSGTIKGLVVGNPEGYKTPSAINVGVATLAVQSSTLLSDKVVVHAVNVQAPEITFETDLRGNNLSKILANLDAATGGGTKEPAPAKESKKSKKLQVDEFNISGGKIHLSVTALGGKEMTVPLPDIHLKDLGTGPEGITPAELTSRVLKAVLQGATEAATGAVANVGKAAADLTKDAAKAAADSAGKVTKGIGDLFKKK